MHETNKTTKDLPISVHFLYCNIYEKASDDYRAYLYWGCSRTLKKCSISYDGASPLDALQKVWDMFLSDEDRRVHSEYQEDWE